MTVEHLPVLAGEVVEMLSPREGGIYVDATVGLGGHSAQLLPLVGTEGKIIGIDRDDEALDRAATRLNDARVILRKGRFSEMKAILQSIGIGEVDGVLLDLGVSSLQLKTTDRGFSFLSPMRLDMRMDQTAGPSAWDVVNRYTPRELVRILKEYGEEWRAERVVRFIVSAREEKTIDTCAELARIVSSAVGRAGRTHPATKTFQALRIEVNGEMDELAAGIRAAMDLLKKGRRFCVISYHSLEDRIVKNFIRDRAKDHLLRPLTKKPLVPTIVEIRTNPSARSAKLRAAEKL